MKNTMIVITLLIAGITACQKKGKELDSPISGSIRITADESLRPLVEAELQTFAAIYTNTDIECTYLSEADAIDAVMKDSARLTIVTRRFTQEEKNYFKSIRITPTEYDIAISGVAVILNNENPDTLMSLDEIKGLLEGKYTSWDQLGGKSKAGIEIVFDHPNSGLVRHLMDSVVSVDRLPDNVYAAENNPAVIDYVAKTPNALGFIGLEWISDQDDSLSNSFLNRVKVAGISATPGGEHYQPYQAYIALKNYPLTRRVTVLSREARVGLGRGFLNFCTSERGQRIVLKAGLVPITMPLRIINVTPANIKIE